MKYANLYNNTTDSNNKQYAIRMLETLSQKVPNSALAQRELAENTTTPSFSQKPLPPTRSI